MLLTVTGCFQLEEREGSTFFKKISLDADSSKCKNISESNRKGMMVAWMRVPSLTMMRLVRWQTYSEGTAQGVG